MKEAVYLALGSNVGNRQDHLERALRELAGLEHVTMRRTSRVIETPPEGKTDQPDFLNAVVELETDLAPETLLRRLQDIEARMGRVRTERWGPRPLDLDILLFGGRRVRTPDLEIPHPRMHMRRFVLEPLAELAPDLVLPGGRKTIRQLLCELEPVRVAP